jgi:hypothetical protein
MRSKYFVLNPTSSTQKDVEFAPKLKKDPKNSLTHRVILIVFSHTEKKREVASLFVSSRYYCPPTSLGSRVLTVLASLGKRNVLEKRACVINQILFQKLFIRYE